MSLPELDPDPLRARLRHLAARLVLDGYLAPELAVAAAVDLLVAGVDAPSVVELAALPARRADLRWPDVEPMFTAVLSDAGVRMPAPETAGWLEAQRIVAELARGAVAPVEAARRLWWLWEVCGEPPELAWMLELWESWESAADGERTAGEAEIVAFAPHVLAVAGRHLAAAEL
ncbi:MAG TPA: hypothetical protein VD813_01115 [Pseudonocardia sp.]|nr:hypothetical protein [Pseudonocardia sp.]